MILSIELTDTEYIATMRAIRRAASTTPRFTTDTDRMELQHLRTLLAHATLAYLPDDE